MKSVVAFKQLPIATFDSIDHCRHNHPSKDASNVSMLILRGFGSLLWDQ